MYAVVLMTQGNIEELFIGTLQMAQQQLSLIIDSFQSEGYVISEDKKWRRFGHLPEEKKYLLWDGSMTRISYAIEENYEVYLKRTSQM